MHKFVFMFACLASTCFASDNDHYLVGYQKWTLYNREVCVKNITRAVRKKVAMTGDNARRLAQQYCNNRDIFNEFLQSRVDLMARNQGFLRTSRQVIRTPLRLFFRGLGPKDRERIETVYQSLLHPWVGGVDFVEASPDLSPTIVSESYQNFIVLDLDKWVERAKDFPARFSVMDWINSTARGKSIPTFLVYANNISDFYIANGIPAAFFNQLHEVPFQPSCEKTLAE
jgi:hypothetical protein